MTKGRHYRGVMYGCTLLMGSCCWRLLLWSTLEQVIYSCLSMHIADERHVFMLESLVTREVAFTFQCLLVS